MPLTMSHWDQYKKRKEKKKKSNDFKLLCVVMWEKVECVLENGRKDVQKWEKWEVTDSNILLFSNEQVKV